VSGHNWSSSAEYLSQDTHDTLYAFVLPPDQAAAYEASDKSDMHSLPAGIQAEAHVDYAWAG
jgi:hypothetical protein